MPRSSHDNDETTSLLDRYYGSHGDHKSPRTLTWAELPAWMQDNNYITAGYRPITYSYQKCLPTLFYLHNESVNIWSHLLGFVVFLGLGIQFFLQRPFAESLTRADYIYFYSFMAGAMICLGFSAGYHCFCCHSEPVAAQWNRCDYAGIVMLIVGSFYPLLYYGFHCHHTLHVVYLIVITTLGLLTTAVVLLRHFRTPAYRWMRTGLFLALGLFGVVPTLHGVWLYGLWSALDTLSLGYLIVMALSYIGGALIYALRIPERWYPGKVNIWGASHQIFHICVLIAVFAHYLGVINAMTYWHSPASPMCVE
ncbi:pPR-type GPCR protein [Dichotomocladium elegans]|nr:pPR-type GPCR protein [Dichotomocladium elegans]